MAIPQQCSNGQHCQNSIDHRSNSIILTARITLERYIVYHLLPLKFHIFTFYIGSRASKTLKRLTISFF
jgi:xanthine/CO dehydrogenase XdhC/CoxF family maturation factor